MMNINWLPFIPFKILSLSTKELYTERIKALDFFDKFYPLDFYLYGRGWNRPQRFSVKQNLFGYKNYKTYKGNFQQKEKYSILSRFKFCLCFDNSVSNGNISEKIFDCFKAGCVPIYLGAPNITDLIDQNCFIDFRKFKNYEALSKFLDVMDEATYHRYQNNIKKFLLSKKFSDQWSLDGFAKLFLKAIS